MGSIVVGLDGSASSVQALRWAMTEAQRRRADVQAVGVFDFVVVDVLGATVPIHPVEGDPARAFTQLMAAVEEVGTATSTVVVEPEVVEGDPTTILVDRSARADLIVIGTGRHHRLGRIGTTASGVLHHARCPVVLVPDPAA